MTDLTTRIAVLEAAGSWRTVPVEPTEAMLEAGADNLFASASENWADEARIIWSAMLSAAPQPGDDALAIIREQQAEIARLREFVASIADHSAFRRPRYAEDDDGEYFLRIQRDLAKDARAALNERTDA